MSAIDKDLAQHHADVRRVFEKADEICFYARPANFPRYRTIVMKDGKEWFPTNLTHFLTALGITPDQVRHIFATWGRLGAMDEWDDADEYDKLGMFHMQHECFQALAALIQKRIAVFREYGDRADRPTPEYTVDIDGTITKPPKEAAS